MTRSGWTSLTHLVLVCAAAVVQLSTAFLILSIDEANSTVGQSDGIPQRVAPNIYIETSPLGTYSADLSRYARRDSNDALITYASSTGFKSLTVNGFSRQTSVWTITAQYTVDNQPLQQRSFSIADVTNLTVVDTSDPNNSWQSWILNVGLGDSCPKDIGIVLSAAGTVPAAPPSVATSIQVPAACTPKTPLQTSTDTLDSLNAMSSHTNIIMDSTDAKAYFRADTGRIRRGSNSEGSVVYHVDNGISQLEVVYYRCEPTDATLLVVPYSDPSCMGTPVALKGQLDSLPPAGCWHRYVADVWLNTTPRDLSTTPFCPPSNVKLVFRGGKDGSELQVTNVDVTGYGPLDAASSSTDLLQLPYAGGSGGAKLLPTRVWIPIVSCILGALFAVLLGVAYKFGWMKKIDLLITGRDRKRHQYGLDDDAMSGTAVGKPVKQGSGQEDADLEAPTGRVLSRQLGAAWAASNYSGSENKSATEQARRTGSGVSVPRSGSSLRASGAPGLDDPVLQRFHAQAAHPSHYFEPAPQAIRPAVARAMTFEPTLPPPIRTRPRRDNTHSSATRALISDDYTPIGSTRSPLNTNHTTHTDNTPRDNNRSLTSHDPTATGARHHDPSPLGNRTLTPHEFRVHTPRDHPNATPRSGATPSNRNTPTVQDGQNRIHSPRNGTPNPLRTGTSTGHSLTPSQTPTQAHPSSSPYHPYGPPAEGTTLKATPNPNAATNAQGEGGKQLEERLADLQKKIVEIKKYLSSRKPDSSTANDKKLGMLKRIGQGGFGVVWKASWEGTVVAVKIMVFPNNMSGEEKAEKMALMEMAISGFLTHPNIVQTFTCEIRPIMLEDALASSLPLAVKLPSLVRRSKTKDKDKGNTQWMDWSALKGSNTQDSMSFFNEKDPTNNYSWELRIIMEYCDAGTLKDALKARRFLLDSTPGLMMDHVLLTALDIARGVRHLHEHQVIHGDLKPHNILLRRSKSDARGYVAKIADFGLSIKMQAKQTIVSGVTQGTDGYMSPEVIHQGKVLTNSDVYSYGIMLWELYTCRAVHDDLRAAKLPKHLITKWRPAFPPNCPAKYVNLTQQCWDPNPYNRPTIKVIMDELSEMLKLVRRQTVSEAKQHAHDAVHRASSSSQQVPDSLDGVAPTTTKMIFPVSHS